MIRYLGPRLGLMDRPGGRKIHDHAIPLGGGIGIWLGVVVPLAVCVAMAFYINNQLQSGVETKCLFGMSCLPIPDFVLTHLGGVLYQSGRLIELLGLGTVLLVLGTLDDRFGLSWKIRILVQLLVASIAVFRGWHATVFCDVPWLTSILSVLWIVALINSFNMLDNMDGLSGGVAFICSAFLVAVLLEFTVNPLSGQPQLFLAGLLVLLMGAIAGFLVHNSPNARLFMGDGGAYFIGFLLATTTLSATFVSEAAPRQAIFVPLCIFAVPLYDITSVIFIRLSAGKSPFVGDRNHYSHRLVALGLSRTGAVLTIYLTTTVCSIGALFLYQVSWFSACLVLGQVLLILLLVAILEFSGRKKQV